MKLHIATILALPMFAFVKACTTNVPVCCAGGFSVRPFYHHKTFLTYQFITQAAGVLDASNLETIMKALDPGFHISPNDGLGLECTKLTGGACPNDEAEGCCAILVPVSMDSNGI